MNPSTAGWITKFGHLISQSTPAFTSYDALYNQLIQNGFIYGTHLYIPNFIDTELKLTEDEIAKINLLVALYFCYTFSTKNNNFQDFIDTVFDYYEKLELSDISFLQKILSGKKTVSQLEKLLDSRIYLNGGVFNKAIGNSLTNSLLFVDVLIFQTYLEKKTDILTHAKRLEYVTINIAYHALNSKETNKKDAKLIQLLASSLTFVDLKEEDFDGSYLEVLRHNFSAAEKQYLLDMACLTVWEDKSLEYTESEFIYGIGKDLEIPEKTIKKSLENVGVFFAENLEKIPYLKDHNLAQKYYEGMAKNVGKLLLRNSKRLRKELSESKELGGTNY